MDRVSEREQWLLDHIARELLIERAEKQSNGEDVEIPSWVDKNRWAAMVRSIEVRGRPSN